MDNNTKPKQNNNNSTDDIPLSEDLLFNYISGLTGNGQPQSQQQKPPVIKTNNSSAPSASSKQSQESPKLDEAAEIEKIKNQIQQEIQKKKEATGSNSSALPQNTQAKSTSKPQGITPPAPTASTKAAISVSGAPLNNTQPQSAPAASIAATSSNISSNLAQQQAPSVGQQIGLQQPPSHGGAPTTNVPPTVIPAKEISMPTLLEEVIKRNASDLHLVVGYPPLIRIDGALIPYGTQPLNPKQLEKLIYSILTPEKRDILEVNKEVDFGYGYKDLGRFRVNAYHSKGHLAAALRLIPNRIRSIEELRLPKMYHNLADLEQGFVLVTGPTGHGKSTTLAAIIQEINLKYPKHILTVEDPIEYVFPPAKALVTQRELGEDTNSWKIALRSALREDPDVVLIGEMRDFETIAAAINIAETGHLVFSTLHTNSASQTIDRIISVFPAEQQNKVRSQLAEVIKVIISQRLIPLRSGGRIAVSEVMIMNNAIKNLIREGKIYQIDNVIRTAAEEGMISLERSLVELVKQKLISLEDARKYAWDPEEVNRLISMAY